MERQVRRFAIFPVITLLWVNSTVVGQAPPPLDEAAEKKDGQAVPESEAHSNYELAVSFFKSGNYETAGRWLEEFLKRHPQSADAPEAAYDLAMSFILQDKPEEAKKVFDRIVADYFTSPWAGVLLRANYDEDAVFKLAGEKHAKGRREKNAKETAAALQIFELYGVRTKGQKNKAELIYKVGDCCHTLEQTEKYLEAMIVVQNLDQDGVWGKLAAIRLGGSEAFRSRMDELINLGASGDEHLALFLELADQHAAELDLELKIKCEFYKARCYGEDKEKRLATFRAILRDCPSSFWAAESSFWLAEDAFSQGEFAKARKDYEQLLKTYPKSRRAAQVRHWITCLDQLEQTSSQIHKVLEGTIRCFCENKGSLAFTLQHETKNKDEAFKGDLRLRFAYQSNDLLLDVNYGEAGFLFANNQAGSWYHTSDQNAVLRLRQRMKTPVPDLEVNVAPDSNNLSFQGKIKDGDQEPSFQLSPLLPQYLVKLLKTSVHMSKETVKTGNGAMTLFRFQSPSWDSGRESTMEVWVDRGGKIKEARLLWPQQDNKMSQIRLSDVSIGEALPAEKFAVQPPAGVPVREVEEIGTMEVFAQVMRLAGLLMNQAKSEMPGR